MQQGRRLRRDCFRSGASATGLSRKPDGAVLEVGQPRRAQAMIGAGLTGEWASGDQEEARGA
jgi:hypothetical protein